MTPTEVPVNASQTVTLKPIGHAARRASARIAVAIARERLLYAAGLLDGDLPTVHVNSLAAVTAVDDVLAAIDHANGEPVSIGHNESRAELMDESERLRRWAIEHNENGAELAAESRGEC